jgi:hypothetical protein
VRESDKARAIFDVTGGMHGNDNGVAAEQHPNRGEFGHA